MCRMRRRRSGGLVEDGVEHRREVAGRGIDDLQHLSGRGLLLQGLAGLGDQTRVLDRDDRLRGEILQQCDLLVGKRAHFFTVEGQGAEQSAILAKRRDQCASRAAEIDGGLGAARSPEW